MNTAATATSVKEIRKIFERLADLTPEGEMLEILSANFRADEDTIYGRRNEAWIKAELEWHQRMRTNVNDFDWPNVPPLWENIAGHDGEVNSVFGPPAFGLRDPHDPETQRPVSDYSACVDLLRKDPDTRRAVIQYMPDDIHTRAFAHGRNDYCCTAYSQFFIREGRLVCVVNMRSSDAVMGYRNDLAWHRWLLGFMRKDLGLPRDTEMPVFWHAGSLHVYPRHRHLVTGEKR